MNGQTKENFGLINRSYETDEDGDESLTQWQRFEKWALHLADTASVGTMYKVLYVGRHGEGHRTSCRSTVLSLQKSVRSLANESDARQRRRSQVWDESVG